MTDHLPAPFRGSLGCARRRALLLGRLHLPRTAILLSGLLLQACSQPAPVGSRLRVYAADLQGGATMCEVPTLTVVAGQRTEATMKIVNDGGWCGVPVSQPGPKPFDAGLLSARADHGSVVIHEVGDNTRIDYTPDKGFTGTDSFVVTLIPGAGMVHVRVTVTPPGGAPKA